MSSKPANVPQRTSRKVTAPRRVSVCLPPDIERKVQKFAKAERRMLSPSIVLLVEKGLAAEGAAPA